MWQKLMGVFGTPARASADDGGLSRREMLGCFGAAGLFAVAGGGLLASGQAEAQTLEVQHGPPRGPYRPGPPPGRRQGPPRGRRQGPPRGRRYRRGDLVNACRRDPGFRRRNREACSRVAGLRRGRPGSCFQVGPIQICE